MKCRQAIEGLRPEDSQEGGLGVPVILGEKPVIRAPLPLALIEPLQGGGHGFGFGFGSAEQPQSQAEEFAPGRGSETAKVPLAGFVPAGD